MESSDNMNMIMLLMKTYLAQMDSSVRISKILCEHSDHDEVSGDDIIGGLVYRLMTPMGEDEMKESVDSAEHILEDPDSEDDYDDIPETYKKPKISRQIVLNTCKCDICKRTRKCIRDFKDYETSDYVSQSMKKSIEKVCKEHKIKI